MTRVRLVQRALERYITRSVSTSWLMFLFSVFDSNTVEGKQETKNTKKIHGNYQSITTNYLQANQTP